MMASTRGVDNSTHLIEKTCCKCSKSEEEMDGKQQHESSGCLKNAVSTFEKRRGDLVNRQQYLKRKITTMERSIPALIALNMMKNCEKSEDSPLCIVKEMMKKMSPHDDPTDKLLNKLATTVKNLNGQTAELHDKIIAADIKLEESQMELESVQLASKELDEKLKSLEKELNIHETPSLHSIYSNDLICLSKIRQLGEAEINLKNNIRQLEARECLFHRQMDRILKSKQLLTNCGGSHEKIRQLECNERKIPCDVQSQRCSVQQMKKKNLRNAVELVSTDDIENLSSTNTREIRDKDTNAVKVVEPSMCSVKFYPAGSKSNLPKGQVCVSTCAKQASTFNRPCDIVSSKCKGKSVSTVSRIINPVSGKRQVHSWSSDTLCPKFHGLKIGKQCPRQWNPTDCNCTCNAKCAATGKSTITCNCAAIYLSSVDAEVNQQSSTDDEYCECCDCSCEDSQSDAA